MCGRITQISLRKYYSQRLSPYEIDYQKWTGGDAIPQYNCGPGGVLRFLHTFRGTLDSASLRWGYRTPREVAERTPPWINAPVEKALTGCYFGHMFKQGRIIVPSEGWYEGRSRTARSNRGLLPERLTNHCSWQRLQTGSRIPCMKRKQVW